MKPHHKTPRSPRQPVLVVLNSDGFVQVYADQEKVDVHCAIMPTIVSDEGQILAEQYLELEMPRRHREVFDPNKLADTHQVRERPPNDIAHRETGLELCRELSEIGEEARTS